MPTATILAGPNGAGKTTFATAYFDSVEPQPDFINADEMARRLVPDLVGSSRDIAAGRLLIDRLDETVNNGRDFVVETTLSSTFYVRRIVDWKARGYSVALIYLRLPSAEASLQRVRRRVNSGGHAIAQQDVLRRFDRSLNMLETVYKRLVDNWRVYDSVEHDFMLSDWSDR